jgi:hypothetical protein
MERHLQSSRKLALFIGVEALCLFLGACGGGGGGGASGVVQVTGMPILTTQPTTTTGSNAREPSTNDQVTALTNTDTEPTTPSATNASAQGVGFASLRWQAPSQRIDGESLSMSEIDGYRIYYGTRSGDYDSVLSVDDPYTLAIQIDDLPVGTYYFVMTTVDTSGLESGYSREALRIVQS